jgi:hypothetical protein
MTSGSRTWLKFTLIAASIVVASLLLDGWAYENIVYEGVHEEDWGRMLRVMGFAPLWLLAGLALIANDWPRRARGALYPALMRGWLLIASVAASGIVGELLKLVFRRERPRAHAGVLLPVLHGAAAAFRRPRAAEHARHRRVRSRGHALTTVPEGESHMVRSRDRVRADARHAPGAFRE